MLKLSLIFALVFLIDNITAACTDFNSTVCQSYASKGYCLFNIYVNGSLITTSCAASCNPSCKNTSSTTTNTASTTTKTALNCTDYNSTVCQSYANKNYCSLNIYVNGALITTSCAASCNSLCKSSNSTTTTSSPTTTTIYTSCSPSPCQNGGTCILVNGIATCLCPDNYNGTYCQTTVNGCISSPCLNNGICNPNSGQYSCTCIPGFTGANCQTQITTTTTISPTTCTDYNSTVCQLYASKGYCYLNVYVNGALITTSCAASCNPSCKNTSYTTTKTTSTTTTALTCTDYNSTVCQSYASKNYCSLNIYVNGSLITKSCAASCNSACKTTTTVITTTTTKTCSDYNSTLCQNYASKGYCLFNIYLNNAPIKVSCAVSCNGTCY